MGFSNFNGIFHCQPSNYWGTPIAGNLKILVIPRLRFWFVPSPILQIFTKPEPGTQNPPLEVQKSLQDWPVLGKSAKKKGDWSIISP